MLSFKFKFKFNLVQDADLDGTSGVSATTSSRSLKDTYHITNEHNWWMDHPV